MIDPCVGQGTALQILTKDAPARLYGVELDAERARIASSKGIETVQGNTFDAIVRSESFSLLYLNPPYDSEIGSIANRRMEAVFLEHTYRWLAMEGILVFVIPFERLHDCVGVLSSHFAGLNVYRMNDPDSVQYRQIVVFGIRREVRGYAVRITNGSFIALVSMAAFRSCRNSSPAFARPMLYLASRRSKLAIAVCRMTSSKTCSRNPARGGRRRRCFCHTMTLPPADRLRRFMEAMSVCSARQGC